MSDSAQHEQPDEDDFIQFRRPNNRLTGWLMRFMPPAPPRQDQIDDGLRKQLRIKHFLIALALVVMTLGLATLQVVAWAGMGVSIALAAMVSLSRSLLFIGVNPLWSLAVLVAIGVTYEVYLRLKQRRQERALVTKANEVAGKLQALATRLEAKMPADARAEAVVRAHARQMKRESEPTTAQDENEQSPMAWSMIQREQIFREGAEGWSNRQRMTSCILFGIAQLGNLTTPLAVVLPQIIVGGILTLLYLRARKNTDNRKVAVLQTSKIMAFYAHMLLVCIALWFGATMSGLVILKL